MELLVVSLWWLARQHHEYKISNIEDDSPRAVIFFTNYGNSGLLC